MAGYIGTKAVNLSTTGADINGNANINGDMTFGDNDKAIFGAGSDLQIYHNGSNSFIDDVGTGNLFVRANNLRLSNADNSQYYLIADNDGFVKLNYAGATKLATTATGVDVTGNVTADGNVGIGTATPTLSSGTFTGAHIHGQNGAALRLTNFGQGQLATDGFDIQHDSGGDTFFVNRDSGNLRHYTGGSERLRIDASGNVGIGTSAPNHRLHLENFNASLAVISDVAGSSTIFLGDTADNNKGRIIYTQSIDTMKLLTNGSERMRIDASGNVLAGTTSVDPIADADGGMAFFNSGSTLRLFSASTALALGRNAVGDCSQFYYHNGTSASKVGSIALTASATAYNTSSDYRLKENITPVQGAADIVKAMQPVTYTFKSDGSWHDGFLAHELQELHPRAVIGEKDGMRDEEYEVTPAVYEDIIIPAVEAVAEVPAVYDDEGVLVSEMIPAVEAQPERTEQQLVSEAVMGTRSVPDYQGVDYSKLTPILTAALQEALNKIDALEARLTALEATP